MHTIYLTTECNFSCTYCYENYINKSEMNEVSLAKNIDFIFKIDDKQNVGIAFMGGEPLLKKELIIFAVKYIENKYPDKTLRYYITTNCSLLNSDFIDFMKKYNFSVRLSFDGIKEAQEINRKNKNGDSYYEQIFNHIQKIRDREISFSIRMTITKNTIRYLYENIVFFHTNKLDNICMDLDVNIDFDANLYDLFKEQISKIAEYYIEELQSGNKFAIDQFDGKFLNILCDFGNHFTMCDAGVSNFKYMPNGDIYPCGFVTDNEKFIIGNIESHVDTNKAKLIAYSLFKKEPNKCTGCEIKNFCYGMKCGYMNYICTSNINIPSELTCKYEKIYYPIVMKIIKYISEDKKIANTILDPYYKFIQMDSLKLSQIGAEISEYII